MVGQIRISSTAQIESNRAIYVDPDNGVLANRANIYLLKNVNGRALLNDKNGIFEFYDIKFIISNSFSTIHFKCNIS